MHTHSDDLPLRPSSAMPRDSIYTSFKHVFDAPQTNTDLVITEALRKTYPDLHLTISSTYGVNYLGFAATGQAVAVPIDTDDAVTANLKWKFYAPPAKRMDGGEGALGEQVSFGKYLYTWNGKEYLLYIIIGMQGGYSLRNSYMLGSSKEDTESLMVAAGHYASELHDEILVFDGGYWTKSGELWRSVEKSTWDDVILDEGMKKAIMGEIHKFFDSRERYARLKVPWKRGIIYYGPPGNGKTISIKATMHALSRLPSPIPTLYVRSLSSYGGPEYSISSIFRKARQFAPCYLIFEDLDSIVTDRVRSYFLNEVDGLESNDGILMIGSTNHLERLDPGISKRPSRFDRKYLFPNPDEEQRVQYCAFWRKKLEGEDEVEFPECLDKAIAGITDGFSFAYMQEAFVASLLAIAGMDDEDGNEDGYDAAAGLPQPTQSSTISQEKLNERLAAIIAKGVTNPPLCPANPASYHAEVRKAVDDLASRYNDNMRPKMTTEGRGAAVEEEKGKELEKYMLWRQMKKQVAILRKELGEEKEKEEEK